MPEISVAWAIWTKHSNPEGWQAANGRPFGEDFGI